MKVISSIKEIKDWRQKLIGSVGFVPTMGYLHEGHLELVRRARAADQHVAVSIFVNPTQFGPHEDLSTYPHDPDRDLALLKKEGVDMVFMPDDKEVYPDDFSTWVNVERITKRLEGASRPGHFRGVTTVVAKLFNIVGPDRAYFGQKDAQQALVIKKMVTDLNMNLEIVVVPTVREPDGLAMSSRNIYLDQEERKAALVLYKALTLAQELYEKGERSAAVIRNKMTEFIQGEPRVILAYVSVADTDSLEELDRIDRPTVISMAVSVGKTRLIDNMIIMG
ncbi:pantoate--beta-alanine ligase [Chloroflexota bacterium]